MSRPTNSNKKFAKNSTELRQLIADTDLEVISQRVRYVEKAGEMKTLSRKLQSQLEIQIGLEAKIAQDKKELERTRREILKQEQVLKGHKGVEGYAETKRKEYLTQLLISDASLAVSEEKNRAAAEKEGADLVRIYNEFNNRTTRGTIAKQEDRNKAAACVLQLKEFVTSFKPIVNPKKDALVAYLRSLTPPQNDAANSINAQGYIANQTQRNDVSRALDALQTQVTNPSPRTPRTTIAAPNPLPAEGIAILTAILQDEINKLTVTKNAAETERNQILTRSLVLTLPAAKTIVDEEKKRVTAVNVKKKDYEERAKELRDKAITDLDKTSPGLFDRLQARANAATEVVSIIDAKINQVFEILHDVKAGKEITEVNKNAEALHILSSLFLANTVTGVTNIDNAENLLKNKLKTIIKIRNNLLAGVAINGAEKDEAKRILASKPALFTEIDLNGTIPSLLNALNGSDYEIVSLAKEYDSIREKADLEKTKVESDIATKDRQRTIDINTGADPSVVNLMEDSIAEKQFELGGVEEKINYLKKLKKESESSNQIERSNQIKAQITKLYAEYNSSVEEQNKLKSEETECDFEIISQEIILQTKRLDKSSITSAEASGLTRDNALELREKAIKAQRTALGEVAVKELAEKWKSDSEAIAREREAPINVFNTAAADAETQRDAQLVAIAANPADLNSAKTQITAAANILNNVHLNHLNDASIMEALDHHRNGRVAQRDAILDRSGDTGRPQRNSYWFSNPAVTQIELLSAAYAHTALTGVLDKNQAIVQQRAYNDAYNNAVLGRVSVAQKNAAIAQQRAYNDAYNNAVLGRVNDTQKDEAIAQQGRYVAAKESLSNLALVNNFGEIADKFFIYGGYTEVKAFWDRQNNNTKSNEAKRLKEAAELEVAKNLGLIKEETTKKELLETELSKLEKEIAAAQKDVDNKTDLGSDVTEEEKNSLLRLKHSKSTTKASIDTKATKIDNLKSALTLNLMKVGGQNLIAKNADKAIQNAALEARNQAILEEAEYKKFLVLENASQANELRIEKQLSLYDIDYSITDEGKKLEITKTEESNGVASTVLLDSLVGDDKKRVELASEVVESLFSLNNDSNREMDLVPELRSSKRIQARPNSDGAEIFVVFDDPAQASAFCYKMNKFTKINEVTKETKPIIDPEASFVTGFDSYGNSKNESQQVLWKKKKIGEELPIINKRFKIPEFEINTGYQAPKFEDKSKPDLDGKYVVSITVGREYDTSITFVDDILNSDRARTLQDRVKNANRAERVIEKKDEGVKTALSVVANLTIVGPGLVGALASGLRWITEPAAKLGVPGSGILSAINQSMYDFAAATTKRGNPFGLVAPNKMEQLSNKFAKASDDLQKIQEKNIAKGLFHWDSKNPLKSFFRPFENITMTVARIGFGIPAVISKGTSLLAHGVGDYLINASKYCSKTADAQWNQGSPNPLYFGVLYGISAVSGVIGLASRTVGVITGGVGEALSKPCKAVNPEGGAASNRSKLGLGFGALIRKIDRGLYDIRNYLFASKEATETSLNLSAAGKMDSAEIKQKADSSQIKEKFNFDALIQAIALDTENPKFNQSSGIEGDNKKYMKVAQVSYNNNKYKVLLGVDGNVVITESGISKSGIPDSLSGRLPSFFAEVLEVVAKTRKSEEEASTSYLTRSTTGITMREFGEKFGGISSSSSCAGASESINEGEVLRGYLSTLKKKQYVVNKIQDVAGYSVKVDENDHIHIGKKGEELKEIEEGKASTNLALFEVVSELSKGKNKKNKHNSSESSNSSGSSNLPEGSVDISGIDVVENLKGERYPTNGKRNDRRVRRR